MIFRWPWGAGLCAAAALLLLRRPRLRPCTWPQRAGCCSQAVQAQLAVANGALEGTWAGAIGGGQNAGGLDAPALAAELQQGRLQADGAAAPGLEHPHWPQGRSEAEARRTTSWRAGRAHLRPCSTSSEPAKGDVHPGSQRSNAPQFASLQEAGGPAAHGPGASSQQGAEGCALSAQRTPEPPSSSDNAAKSWGNAPHRGRGLHATLEQRLGEAFSWSAKPWSWCTGPGRNADPGRRRRAT